MKTSEARYRAVRRLADNVIRSREVAERAFSGGLLEWANTVEEMADRQSQQAFMHSKAATNG